MPELRCSDASTLVSGTSGFAQPTIEIVVVGLVVDRRVVQSLDHGIVHRCAKGLQDPGHGREVTFRELVEKLV
jgi:hypothetical protein